MIRNGSGLGVLCAATIVLIAGIGPASAHHSFAMYDQSENRVVTGKLIRFIPGANHAQLIFELVGDDGEVRVGDDGKPLIWGAEMGSAAQIASEGITVDSFPLGTVLTITVNPLRDGRPFGAQARGTPIIKCGMAMPSGGCTRETGEVFMDTEETRVR